MAGDVSVDALHALSKGVSPEDVAVVEALRVEERATERSMEERYPLPCADDALFYHLWSKAVGTDDYDTSEWLRLERMLQSRQPSVSRGASALDPVVDVGASGALERMDVRL